MRNSLRVRLTLIFIGLAIGPLLLVGIVLAQRSFTVEQDQALNLQNQVARQASAQAEAFLRAVESDLLLLGSELRNLGQPDRGQQLGLLLGKFSSSAYGNVYEELTLLDNEGQEVLRLARLEVIPSEQLINRAGSDEFEQAKATGETYFGPVQFDDTGEPFMSIAIPLFRLRSVQLDNVLVAKIRFRRVGNLRAAVQESESQTSQTVYMIDSAGRVVAHQDSSFNLQGSQFNLAEQEAGSQTGLDGTEVVLGTDDIQLGEQVFTVVAETPEAEALQQATSTVFTIVVTILISLAVAIILDLLIARQIVRPIETLVSTTQAISAGDLSQRVEINSRDELGALANAFNTMTIQLRSLIDTLEERILERTQRLEIAASLGERLSAILNLENLLAEIVNQIKDNFDYYHAHIYLFDDQRENLVVAEGTGEAGAEMKRRGHSIALNAPTSLVARAARTGEVVTVDNVREASDWLPNLLLPDTYSEMAVPIILDEQVVGVLDVQDDEIAGLDEGDANLLRSLANQVAVAIRNARQFEQTETALAEARAAQERYLEQSWQQAEIRSQRGQYRYSRAGTPVLDETALTRANQLALTQDKIAIVTLNSGNDSPPESNQEEPTETENPKSIVAPITLQDRIIGTLQLHPAIHNQTWTEDDLAIVEAVVDQLGQTAENIRLFEETLERAGREQTIREITDKLRAAPNLDTLLETAARELGQRLGVRHTVLELGIEAERHLDDNRENGQGDNGGEVA